MYCGHCGSQVAQGNNFCERCGKRVSQPAGLATPSPAREPQVPVREGARWGKRLAMTLGSVAVAFSLLAWWLVYGGRTQWELHRQGSKVFVVGESESTVTMIGSTSPVHVALSLGCEDGKDFIHLSPVPVLPIGESGGKAYAVTLDEMFYLHRTDSGRSHVVRNTGWATIPPSVVTLERLDEPDSDPALGRPTPTIIASNVPRFAHRLSESGLYVLNGGSLNLAFGTDGLREQMPELRAACGW